MNSTGMFLLLGPKFRQWRAVLFIYGLEDIENLLKDIRHLLKLLKEIQDLVAVQAAGLGFDLVFDIDGTSTSQVPMLLFARDAMDITPMMLKELNKTAPSRG